MYFVEKSGVTNIKVGDKGEREGTPILEIPQVTQGNSIIVTVNFFARTNADPATRANGFYFDIQTTKPDDAQALTTVEGIVQGNSGWQSVSKTVIFNVSQVDNPSGVEDIDLEVLFRKGDIDGQGAILDFQMIAELIVSDNLSIE